MQSKGAHQFRFQHLFDGTRWHEDVIVAIDAEGWITALGNSTGDDEPETVRGIALPGMPNLHSHAFQRAMAGLAEYRSRPDDSFWSWRELMYDLAGSVTADDIGVIAQHLYIEMLKAGFTSVCEFHYLHHDVDGRPYPDPAEHANRHIAAAEAAGFGLTVLPVLYQRGGFDGRALTAQQQRFHHETEGFVDLYRTLRNRESDTLRVGAAIHSLRAVDAAGIRAVVEAVAADGPIHIHVAEQTAEVEDCLAATGRRPVDWLMNAFEVNERWCLVHATHLNDQERRRIAGSGAVAGLCPTTEANLGDGIFPFAEHVAQAGRFGIGSDSHVSVSAVEELRLLEYGQRLRHRRRIVALDQERTHCGEFLWGAAAAGGGQASGRPVGTLVPGARADLVVIDPDPEGLPPAAALDRFIFATGGGRIRDVMVGGRWRVKGGRHPLEEDAHQAFAEIVRSLLEHRA